MSSVDGLLAQTQQLATRPRSEEGSPTLWAADLFCLAMTLAETRITLHKDGLLPDRTREEQSSALTALISTAQAASEYFFPFSPQVQTSDDEYLHETIRQVQPGYIGQICKQLFRCAAILLCTNDLVRAASLARLGRVIERTHPTIMSWGGLMDGALKALNPRSSSTADTAETANRVLADAQITSKLHEILSAENTEEPSDQHAHADHWAEVEASLITLRSMDDASGPQAESGIGRANPTISRGTGEQRAHESTNRISIANLTST